jgi:hypothetical protein
MTSQFTTHLDAAGIHRCITRAAKIAMQVIMPEVFAAKAAGGKIFAAIGA